MEAHSLMHTGKYGAMMRVRIGSPTGEIKVAHWKYNQNATDEGDNYSAWVIHGLGFFTLDDDERAFEKLPLDQPMNFSQFQKGTRTGEIVVYDVHDHPDDLPKNHQEERRLRLSCQPHESGLPVWIEPGTNGRCFLYHSGYDVLIPLEEWDTWLSRWANGELKEKPIPGM